MNKQTIKKITLLLIFLITITALIYKINQKLLFINHFNQTNLNNIKILDMENEEKSLSLEKTSIKVLSANLIAEFEEIPLFPSDKPPSVSQKENQNEVLNDNLNSESLPEIPTQENSNSPTPTKPLAITLTPPPMRIKSLRILGEIKNTGTKEIQSLTPLITFYDAQNQKIAVKVANFSDDYFFPKLKPNEKYFYDIVSKDLPENFQNLNISFKGSTSSSKGQLNPLSISQSLKIENKHIEENIASGSAETKYYYYRFKAEILNTNKKTMKNVTAVVYAKDKNDRVFAWNKQQFPSDIFSENDKQKLNILIIPLKNEKAENFEIFLFGEEL